MQYIVSKPSSFMHLYPDAKSEVTDELLYGTCATSFEESYGGFVFCVSLAVRRGCCALRGICVSLAVSQFCGAVRTSITPSVALRAPPQHKARPLGASTMEAKIRPCGVILHIEAVL